MTDRVDEVVELALPENVERAQLLDLYFNKFVVSSGRSRRVTVAARQGGRVAALDRGPGCGLQQQGDCGTPGRVLRPPDLQAVSCVAGVLGPVL